MRDQIIELIHDFMIKSNRVFLSEADLQVNLAFYLKKQNKEVFLEYHVKPFDGYPWENENIYIDIVIKEGNQYLPIEVKYKTSVDKIDLNVFGKEDKTLLKQQGAQSNGRYDFWKDVKRLELLKKVYKIEEGIALFVTNDKSYRDNPKSDSKKLPQYYKFNICEGISEKNKSWREDTNKNNLKSRPNFELDNNYILKWEEQNIEGTRLLYLIPNIKK